MRLTVSVVIGKLIIDVIGIARTRCAIRRAAIGKLNKPFYAVIGTIKIVLYDCRICAADCGGALGLHRW
jgi:hypothetical protein